MTVILTDMRFGFQCHALHSARGPTKSSSSMRRRAADRLWPFISVTHCFVENFLEDGNISLVFSDWTKPVRPKTVLTGLRYYLAGGDVDAACVLVVRAPRKIADLSYSCESAA